MLFEAALESSVFVVELRTLAASCNPWMQAGGTPCSMGITRGTRGTLGNTISLFGAYVSLTAVEPCIAGSGGGLERCVSWHAWRVEESEEIYTYTCCRYYYYCVECILLYIIL